MNWLKEWIETICISLPAVTVAILGGALSYLSSRTGDRRFSWYWFIVGTAGAGFVGIIMHCALGAYDIRPGIKSAIIGISGYASNDVLLIVKKRFLDGLRRGLLK